MRNQHPAADRAVDALYGDLRGRYGPNNARANGYVSAGYFLKEQRILFSLLDANAQVLLDIACGSGLMLRPLVGKREQVIGLDYNLDACQAAFANGLVTVRGDAFDLPLRDNCVDEIVSCQFFNQQDPDGVERFIAECARVLRSGGRLIVVWRNGTAWVHKIALGAYRWIGRLRRRAVFPYVNHPRYRVAAAARAAGLQIQREAVSFPPLQWLSDAPESFLGRWIGASNICIARKPDGAV